VSGGGLLLELREELTRWRGAGLGRSLAPGSGRDFTSNDTLALARHPELVAAARAALEEFGVGAGAARLLRGDLPVHRAAEERAAAWLGEEAALLFPSGYQANAAALSTFAARGDLILSDERNHASLIDGARLSRAAVAVFAHNDADDLGRRLAAGRAARRRLIVVESVYSMDGDLAPLAEFAALASRHDAWLVVDEAHAAGLFGPRGSGLARSERLLIRTVTGGKALGAGGAFLAGPRVSVETLLQHARPFVFTTAPLPALAAALVAAIGIVEREPGRRERALARAARLRAALRAGGLDAFGESAIVPVILGEAAMRVAARVREEGFDVRAVRPPTVPVGTDRLRIVCHADHEEHEIDALAAALLRARDAPARAAAAPPPAPASTPAPDLLIVAGTGTGVGKTVVAALLARARKARYLKPVQTGAECDSASVRALAGVAAPAPLVRFPLPASVDQAAAAAGATVDARALAASVREAISAGGRWILECAGGLRVPLNDREDQSHLLVALGAPLVLVARSGLGTLNETLLTLEAAALRGLRVRALFLVGEPHAANAATLRRRLAPLPILEVPRFDPLGAEALDAWIARHDLDFS